MGLISVDILVNNRIHQIMLHDCRFGKLSFLDSITDWQQYYQERLGIEVSLQESRSCYQVFMTEENYLLYVLKWT